MIEFTTPCGARISAIALKCWSVAVSDAIHATGGRFSFSICSFIGWE